MVAEVRPLRVRRVFAKREHVSWAAVGIVVLLVVVLLGYMGLVHVTVDPNVVATTQPVAATTVARVGALTQDLPAPTPVVVERAVTVIPNTGFALVTVTASDGVAVRSQPTVASTAVGQATVGSDLMVVGSDVLDPSGASRWIHVRYQGIEGFVRSDLVDAPHAA